MDGAQEQSKSALKKAEKTAKAAAAKAEKAAKKAATVPIIGGASGSKPGDHGKEIIGITASKDVNFSQWYQELVIKAELVEYYNEVKGKTSAALRCRLAKL